MKIDKTKIPQTTRFIIDNYLRPINPRAPYDSFVLPVLFQISKMLCHNRVIISNEELQLNNAYPNVYCISFGKSGSGKDKGTRSMNKIMGFFKEDTETMYQKYADNCKNEIDREIEKQKLSKGKASEYRQEHSPMWLKPNIDSTSTFEGYMEQRKAFEKAGFGCTWWADSEIYDTIKSLSTSAVLFKKANKENFDHGDNQDKTIKGNKRPSDVKGVPNLIFLQGAIDNDEQTNVFKNFFDLGYSRRSLVYVNKGRKEFIPIGREEKREGLKKANRYQGECEKFMKDIYSRSKMQTQYNNGGNKVFILSEDAVDLYLDYDEGNQEKAHGLSNINNIGIAVEVEGRAWKMVKIAACIAIQESTKFVITKEHIESAIYLIDYYGKYFADFYLMENVTIYEKIIEYIRSHPKCTKTDIRKQKFMPSSKYEQTSALKESLEENGLFDILNITISSSIELSLIIEILLNAI